MSTQPSIKFYRLQSHKTAKVQLGFRRRISHAPNPYVNYFKVFPTHDLCTRKNNQNYILFGEYIRGLNQRRIKFIWVDSNRHLIQRTKSSTFELACEQALRRTGIGGRRES